MLDMYITLVMSTIFSIQASIFVVFELIHEVETISEDMFRTPIFSSTESAGVPRDEDHSSSGGFSMQAQSGPANSSPCILDEFRHKHT